MQGKDKTIHLKGLAFISTVFNESGALIPFLASLAGQTALPSEIILVDGGSTDDTLAAIKDFFKGLEKTPGFDITTVFEEVSCVSLKPGHTGDESRAKLRSIASVDSDSVPSGIETAGHDTVPSGLKTAKGDTAPDDFKAVPGSEEKSRNMDYPCERLVFESVINGFTAVKIYCAPGANISTGRNIAIRNANSGFICASDAGCRLSRDWVKEISKYFICCPENNQKSRKESLGASRSTDSIASENGLKSYCPDNSIGSVTSSGTSDDIVAGGYNLPYIENFLQACLAVCILPVKSEIVEAKYMPSSRNISFAKAAWEKAGGYPQNMDFGEDMRFNFNLKSLGYKIRFNPDALVYWNLRNNPSAIFRQFFRYAKGDAVGRMYSHRHFIRFASVLLFIALISASVLVSPWFLLAILLLFSAFICKPYFRIKYYINDKNCCVFAENKKNLLFITLKIIFGIPLMLPYIETAKLAGYIYGLFIRKNHKP